MASKAELEQTNARLRSQLKEICGVRTPYEIKCEMAELRRAVELAKWMLFQMDAQGATRPFTRASEFRDYLKVARYIGLEPR